MPAAWVLAVLLAGATVCAAETVVLEESGQWRSVESLPRDLQAVRDLLDQRQPKKALKEINKWLKQNKGGEVADVMDDALFLKAQAFFDRKRYYQAFETYEQLLDGYGASPWFEPALRQEVEIARRFLAGEKRIVWGFIRASARTEGVEILDRVVERWPGSELAARALMMQADYYYQEGRFVEAQSTYQVIAESYSKSSFYEAALLRSAEATHAQYRGPRYDARCLTDARIRYEQYRARFPGPAEQLGLGERLYRLDWAEAEKHYEIADYYGRTHREGAVRYYVSYLESHWPVSEWTRRARALLPPTPRSAEEAGGSNAAPGGSTP